MKLLIIYSSLIFLFYFSTLYVNNIIFASISDSILKIGTIKDGLGNEFIAFNPNTNLIYVADLDGDISIINGSTNQILPASISLNEGLGDLLGIAVNPNTNLIYVADLDGYISIINGSTNQILPANISLHEGLEGIAVNPNTNLIYVSIWNSNSVSIIDGDTNTIIGNISIDSPHIIEVNPNSNIIYVSSWDHLYVIDGKTNKMITTIHLEPSIYDIEINPKQNVIYLTFSKSSKFCIIDGTNYKITCMYNKNYDGYSLISVNPFTNTIYLLNTYNNLLSVVNGSTNKLSHSKYLDNFSNGIVINPLTNLIYIINQLDNAVSVLNGNFKYQEFDHLIKAGIDLPFQPWKVDLNPNTNQIYIISYLSDLVRIIDGANDKVISNISVGSYPIDIAVNPKSGKIYVTNELKNVSVIDGETNTVVANITVGESPRIAVNPTTNKIYASDKWGRLFVIDGITNKIVNTNYTLGESPRIAVNPTTNKIYSANYYYGVVNVIDVTIDSKITKINIGGNPSAIAVNPNTNLIYVADWSLSSILDNISVIDGETNTVVANITVGESPNSIAVNPNTNLIYVSNLESNSVSVIDGETNTVVANITVGEYPEDIAVNPNTNVIYVPNRFSDNVILIDGQLDQIILPRFTLFNVEPIIGAGSIICNNKEVTINQNLKNQEINLPFNSKCIAEPNEGFHFSNWVMNLENNVTKIINSTSLDYNSPYNFFKKILDFDLFDEKSIFTITQPGKYTVIFEKDRPPVPIEYIIGLYTIAATVFTGWFIPNVARWISSIFQKKRTLKFLLDIEKINQNKNDKKIKEIKMNVDYAYAKGKISETQYKLLTEHIEIVKKSINYQHED